MRASLFKNSTIAQSINVLALTSVRDRWQSLLLVDHAGQSFFGFDLSVDAEKFINFGITAALNKRQNTD